MIANLFLRSAELVPLVIKNLGYPGIVLIMAAENIFPPIPSEVVMPLVGYLATQGEFSLPLAIIAGTLGSVLGALFWYGLAWIGQERVVRTFFRRYGAYLFLSEKDLDRSLIYFQQRGPLIIFSGRLIPLIRSLISIPAGLAKMSLPLFIFFTALGTGIWTTILTAGGALLGENWPRISQLFKNYEHLVLILLFFLCFYLGWRLLQKARRKQKLARKEKNN